MLLLAHAESSIFPCDNPRVVYFLRRFIYAHMIPPGDQGPRGVIGIIGESGGILEGLAMLSIGRMWYSAQNHLEELLVYVDPNFRRGAGRAKALIDWMKLQSDRTGLKLVTGVMSNFRTEAKVRLYRRTLQPIGEFFLYHPKIVSQAFYCDEMFSAETELSSTAATAPSSKKK